MIKGKLLRAKPARAPGSVRLAGWLADSDGACSPIAFEVIGNGEKLGTFTADRPRERSGDEPEPPGFSFNVRVPTKSLPPGEAEFALAVGGERLALVRELRVVLGADGTLAEGSERSVVEQLPVRPIRGRIEAVEDGVLTGWLCDAGAAEPVRFILLANETAVGEFVADRRRRDLAGEGIGNGNHGFRVRIQRSWLGAETVFALRTLPDEQRVGQAFRLDRRAAEAIRATEPPRRWPGEDGTARAAPLGAAPSELGPKDLIAIVRGWSTSRLAAFFGHLEREVMLERGKDLFREKNWAELGEFLPTSLQARKSRVEINTLVGRALLYSGSNADAATVLSGVARVTPDSHHVQFYSAIASARASRLEDAVGYGRAAIRLAPAQTQYLFEHGVHCRRLAAASSDGDVNLRRSLLAESIDAFQRALALDDGRGERALLQIARCEMELDRFAEAVRTLERLLALKPDHVDALTLLSQALVALNRVKDALAIAERVIELDPLRQGPRFQLRSLRTLVDDADIRPAVFGLARWDAARCHVAVERFDAAGPRLELEPVGTVAFDADPALALASLGLDWLILADRDAPSPIADGDRIRAMQAGAKGWAGRLVSLNETGEIAMWRRDLLVNLAESGTIGSIETLRTDLAQVQDIVSTWRGGVKARRRIDLLAKMRRMKPGRVVALSRHGIVKFGGGEHFLDSMAQHYAEMGHDPVIVGTRPERVGEEGVQDGGRYAFVDIAPAALRRFFLRERPRFVHVLSGLGFQVAEALEYLDIPFVYGVHFWRDCLGKAENDTRYFAAHDREPIPKPAFRYVVEKAAAIYANSEYTREILEESFHLRPPVIYSLPREAADQLPGTPEETDAILAGEDDYVLLVNAKSDKGFDLIVEVAKRVPIARFVVIASQSDRQEAEQAIAVSGVSNLRVIDHTARMDIVYSRARAVAVPSYRFIETFSRVCIEAQRYGKPVLGSGIGNVPYLLRDAGTVLPDDAAAWAEAIGRLYEDAAHYEALCAAARANSQRYAYTLQPAAVHGMISALPTRILIAVGSGIGNMLHVSPMIANISRRLGCKVDIVMSEDHQHGLFLLQNDAYVNCVYALRQEVLRRRYDVVFVTHSFGDARVPFQGRHVIYARDWASFDPGGVHHEAVHNLEAAKHLLGIPYDPEDIDRYHIGNVVRAPDAARPLIGIHGGSKDGFWRSKRWPGHAELAGRLQALGYEVASFGIPEEYVPGTIDLTGGTIAEMVERIRQTSYFISNDSGVMNIAHALGLPVMGLFGPTNPHTRGPIGARGRWLAIQKDCAPCEMTKSGREAFYSGGCRCIGELSVDLVEQRVLDHMRDMGLRL